MDRIHLPPGVAADPTTTPLLVEWELSERLPGASGYAPTGPLETAEALLLIDQLARAGTRVIELRSAAARHRADLVELVDHATRSKIATWLVHEEDPDCDMKMLSELHAAGLERLAVRLDGTDGPSHDARRGRDGSFARARSALGVAGLVGVATRADTRLYSDLQPERVVELAAGLGCTACHFVFPVNAGWFLTAAEVEALLERLTSIEERASIGLETSGAPQLERVRQARGSTLGVATRNIASTVHLSDGRGVLCVSFEGEIYPSAGLRVPCGNVRGHEPIEVYRYHPLFRTLRDHESLTGRCGRCKLIRACGGSRARAYAVTGRLMASDPLCAHVPP